MYISSWIRYLGICNYMIPLSAYLPGNDHISHQTGSWENHPQNCLLKGCVRSRGGSPNCTCLFNTKVILHGPLLTQCGLFAHPKRPPFKRFFQSPWSHPSKKVGYLENLFIQCMFFLGEKNGSFLSTSTRLMVKVGDPKVKVPYHLWSLTARPWKVTETQLERNRLPSTIFQEQKLLNLGGVTSRFNRTLSLEMPDFENFKSLSMVAFFV